MDTRQSIEIRSERIKKGMNKAFGCKAETLEKALRTVGRRLPKWVRKKVSLVTTAEGMGGHPKLIQRIDGVALAVAEKEIMTFLKGINRFDARKRYLISTAGMIVLNIFFVGCCYIIWAILTEKL